MLGAHVHHGGKSMKNRAVAESYANEHGLTFSPKETLFRPPTLAGGGQCVNAISGAVADGPPGILSQHTGIRGIALSSAQYEFSGLGAVIDGLWVHKSGRSLWTRVALPQGYTELMLASETFNAHYRVAIASDRDEEAARRLLSADFQAWLTDRALQGGRFSSVETSFEIWRGVLFILGPIDAFNSPDKLDTFARAAARIATGVAALANSPAPVGLLASHAWACDICSGAAGSIALDERGEVRRESFTSELKLGLAEDAAGQLRTALATGDAAAVYALDIELAPWWCPACRKSYCRDHWLRGDVFDEEEPHWHDSIRGRCPEGHERMLED
jgi:hypothetical protein